MGRGAVAECIIDGVRTGTCVTSWVVSVLTAGTELFLTTETVVFGGLRAVTTGTVVFNGVGLTTVVVLDFKTGCIVTPGCTVVV